MKTLVMERSWESQEACPVEWWDAWHSQAIGDEAVDRLNRRGIVPLSHEEVDTVTRVLDLFDGELVTVVRKGKR